MVCSFCKRERSIVAREMCAACYQRWRMRGSAEYAERSRSTCSVGGCSKLAVSRGLCDTHRKRMERHGHLEETRPDSWGAKHKHPLYNSWAWIRRHKAQHPVDPRWDDFLQFAMDVGERPSAKHRLYSADDSRPIGPGNFVWKKAVTERVDGEDERTHRNRAQRAARQLSAEAFAGYDLKRHYGLSQASYEEMLEKQDHKCAVCGRKEGCEIRGKSIKLAVDHCHDKGHIRGLLCVKCNRALGLFGDDPALLRVAADYLEHHAELG